MSVYFIWLLGVYPWNFGFSSVCPIAYVIVAVLLSFGNRQLKLFTRLK